MKNVCVLKRDENTKEENNMYMEAIRKYGGNPILIDDANFGRLNECGGILITGGYTKGKLDDYLIGYAIEKNIPLLGICQGMQSMSMYNTIYKLDKVVNHHSNDNYVHSVYIDESNFKNIVGLNRIEVNSYHYETPRNSNLFRIVGRSTDGLIEVIENPNHPFQIGIQWHPERMINYDDVSNKIFEGFINVIK